MYEEEDFDGPDRFSEGDGQMKALLTLKGFSTRDLFYHMARAVLDEEGLTKHDLSKKVLTAVEKGLEAALSEAMNGIIAQRAERLVDELLTKEFVKTNEWGEKKGETITLREHILSLFTKSLQERVDTDGRNSSYNNGITRLEWIIKKHGTDGLLELAKGQVANVRKEAEKQIAAAVGAFIAQNLAQPLTAATALPKQ